MSVTSDISTAAERKTAPAAVALWNQPMPTSAYRMGRYEHPYVPDVTGTQCSVFGCWGWVDDPRHMRSVVRPMNVRAWGERVRSPRFVGRRWHMYGRCDFPPCSAEAGKPCVTTSGENVGREARDRHHGRPFVGSTDTAPKPPAVAMQGGENR
jgi:hypothetical protein